MICAVIDIEAGVVTNLIVAEADDPAEAGTLLVADPPAWVAIGTKWNGDFVSDTEKPGDGLELL